MSDLLAPGQLFSGRYRIERFLAQGGFGAVYVAEQIETELRVALKVLWPHVLSSRDAVEKFKLEARIAGRVGSDHIVRVFDAGFDEATRMPFLVMELLDGMELERVVEQSGPIPADRLTLYFRQIASALDKAHGYVDRDGVARPIVHRDLKPENLFLTYRESGEPVVKILDFGIAKILGDSTNMSQEVKGTPLYMAFEQASAGKITRQTDVWALGLIAFYLLTGRTYWKTGNLPEASLTQLFGEVLSLPIEAPSKRAADIGAPVIPSRGFDAWFGRCVNREVSERFATAGECAAALASVLGTPETQLSPGAFGAVAFDATIASAPGVLPSAPVIATSVPPTQVSAGAALGASTGSLVAMGRTASPSPAPRAPLRLGLLALVLVAVAVGVVVFQRVAATAGSDARASVSAEPAPIAKKGAEAVPAPVHVAPREGAPTTASPDLPSVTPAVSAAPPLAPSAPPLLAPSPRPRQKLVASSRVRQEDGKSAGSVATAAEQATPKVSAPAATEKPAKPTEVYRER